MLDNLKTILCISYQCLDSNLESAKVENDHGIFFVLLKGRTK